MAADCTHLDQIRVTSTRKRACEECTKTGDNWVHLRMCMVCGYVGCCDSSKNKHANRHFQQTNHPIVRSIEPDESWVWCYIDDADIGELAA